MKLIGMEPRSDLSSTGYALANGGQEYLVLQPSEMADPFTVMLGVGARPMLAPSLPGHPPLSSQLNGEMKWPVEAIAIFILEGTFPFFIGKHVFSVSGNPRVEPEECLLTILIVVFGSIGTQRL